jgi:hypothetical protein
MKKVLIAVLAVALPLAGFATDANQMKYVEIKGSLITADATETGTGVDVSAYKGNAAFIVQGGTPATHTTNYKAVVTLQTSASLSSGYQTITNTAGVAGVITFEAASSGTLASTGSTQTYSYDLSRQKKYIRAVVARTHKLGGALTVGESAPVGVILVAPMKSE